MRFAENAGIYPLSVSIYLCVRLITMEYTIVTVDFVHMSSFECGECDFPGKTSPLLCMWYETHILTHILTHTYNYIYTYHNNYYTLSLSLFHVMILPTYFKQSCKKELTTFTAVVKFNIDLCFFILFFIINFGVNTMYVLNTWSQSDIQPSRPVSSPTQYNTWLQRR